MLNFLQKTIRGIRFLGFWDALPSLTYSLMKYWIEWRFRNKGHTFQSPKHPGKLKSVKSHSQGGHFVFDQAHLDVHFLTPNMVRISWEPGAPPIPYSLAITEWPEITYATQETPDGWKLTTSEVEIVIHSDGQVTFNQPGGINLRTDLPPIRQGEAWTHVSQLHKDEQIHGLGERAAPLNLNPGTYRMWNHDPGGSYGPGDDPLYMTIPVYMGRHADGNYLIFYENSHRGSMSFNGVTAEAYFEGGMLRYYFSSGSPVRLLEAYTQLTGRPPLPPQWALGYHQSRWGYKTEADIREVATGFQEHDMPLSAIHLDIDYMDGYRLFTVDKSRFSDLGGLSAEMIEKQIRLVTILDCGVKRDNKYDVYLNGLEEGIYCTLPNGKQLIGRVWPGWCTYPDFTNPKARRWWADQYHRLLDSGIAGIWHDMNEPTSFSAFGGPSLPDPSYHHMDGRGGNHVEAHNLYALLMNQAGYRAMRQLRPDHRPWLLSRSGWAGLQRFSWNWTADIESTWGALRQTIPTVLGLGLSGVPFTGPDIGGFSGAPDAELFLRWFQMATFLPFFRGHAAMETPRREPWVFGEPYTSIIHHFLKLRYRLMPYLYTLAWESSQTGHPLVRPIFWYCEEDPVFGPVEDAFFLGDALLVAPILEPNAKERIIHLPPGQWYCLWEGTPYEGQTLIEINASFEQIPAFVRGGSVLPMAENGRLTLHVYPPDESTRDLSNRIYSDAGDGYGDWRLDHFCLFRDGNTLEIHWDSEGFFPFPYHEVQCKLYGVDVKNARVDGVKIAGVNNVFMTDRFEKIVWEL